ncbi:hypothetical protein B0H19DRAFT_1216678 [Mycena capillaripes]|nr:hypothetical protein B0H19DRAFT_1216678 [Mycena capillaripes]
MSSPRIITVFGATGLQGTSIVDAVLADGTFTPRAITRNPTSEAAQALAARGAQVAKADLMDKASMVEAMRESEAVFGLTNYFEPTIFPGNPTGEIEQGKNLVDAAKEAGVIFFVFSGPPSTSRLSGGKYTQARHFDNKEVIEKYLQASGLANATIHLGGFLENFWIFKLLKKTPTGFDIAVPRFTREVLHNWTWVTRDVGASVLALLKTYDDPAKGVSGNVYPVITSCVTYPEVADLAGKALGVPVTFSNKDDLGVPELDEMFACQCEFASEFFKGIPVPNPDLVALGVKFSTIEEFMETAVKSRFRVAATA